MLAASNLQAIVCTSRLAEAERFYSEVLGLALQGRSLGALVYDVNGTVLRVSPVPPGPAPQHTVLGFAVADLAATAGALHARGVRAERIPGFDHDACGAVRAPDGTRVMWFRDPDGNLLSVVQYPA